MSNIIAVYNFKGGVGKTSSTLSLAHSWSRSFRVLVIDCDPQANLTQSLTGEKDHNHPTLFNLTKGFLHNEFPEVRPYEASYYLHLIPGDYQMTTMESNTQFISFGPIIFYKLLSSIRNNYDFILLDFPTHFGVTVRSFISNIDSILIPAIPDSFSASGFKQLLKYISEVDNNQPINILGVFFNQFRKHTLYHQKVVEEAEEELGPIILKQRVRESIRVSEANQQKESIYSFMESSDVAEDFMKLSEEVIERLNTSNLDDLVQKFELSKISV